MVIQFNNQHYIKEAYNFSSQLATLQRVKDFLKAFFGLVGLFAFVVVLSPFVVLLILKLINTTSKILKEAKEQKENLKSAVKNGEFSFEELIELEESVKSISSKIVPMAFFKEGKVKILSKLINNLKAINLEMVDMQEIIHNSYVYKAEDLGLNPEDLKEYMDQFKGLEDIWSYEPTIEDKEVVYNHKKQLQSA